MSYICAELTFCYLGMLLGIVIRHYFDDSIPFDRIFEKVEKFIFIVVNFLYKLKQNRFIQFVGKIVKKSILVFFNALKKMGNVIYKNRDAIEETALNCANEIHKEITGKELPEFELNNVFVLRNDEEDAFTKQFEGHPYDTPLLVNSFVQKGVAWYDFQALGFMERYEDLDRKSLIRMLEVNIQKYMRETRSMYADIYIQIATPTRFYFGIALSRHGQKELMKLRQMQDSLITEEAPLLLEEEVIDLFANLEDDES